MARAVEINEPDDLTWALGERRLSVLRALAESERTSVAAVRPHAAACARVSRCQARKAAARARRYCAADIRCRRGRKWP